MTLAKKLKQLRENCGHTQQQIADALNIDRSTYAYYETGKTTPDVNTVVKLSKIFNVSYSEILDDEEHPPRVRDDGGDDILSRYGNRNTSHIYELSKAEQQLVLYHRLLSVEAQQKLLETAASLLEKKEK